MRRRIPLLLFLLVTPLTLATAQNVATLVTPADRILRFRTDLRLDTTQMGKLRDLAVEQKDALGRATSAFLHAEADLVDAGRSSDIGNRRSAMEKRSKMAIEGEMIRLRAEKDARSLLTTKQITLLDILLTESVDDAKTHPIWESQVAPLPLTALPFAAPDSETVRIVVDPLTTEIIVDNQAVGFGRVAMRVPIGMHVFKFRSPNCTDTKQIVVAKGDRAPISHRMSCK